MDRVLEATLIAEFMGWHYDDISERYTTPFIIKVCDGDSKYGQEDYDCRLTPEEMLFDSSWEWLMPVVEKIEELGYDVTIGHGNYCYIEQGNDLNSIWFEGKAETKILSVYHAVFNFVTANGGN